MSSRIKVPLTPSRLAVSPVLAVVMQWDISIVGCCDAFVQTYTANSSNHVQIFSFAATDGIFTFEKIFDAGESQPTSSSNQLKSQVYGNKNNWILVWEDDRPSAPGIYGSRSGGPEFRISSGTSGKNPAIADDLVVWEDYGSDATGDIKAYSLSRGIEFSVATGTTSQRNPRVYGNRIVWEEKVNGLWGVHTALVQWPEAAPTTTPTETAVPTSTQTEIPRPTPRPTITPSLTASYADPATPTETTPTTAT